MSWGAELLPILAPNSKEIWCSLREVFPAWIVDRHSFNQLREGNSRLLQMKSRLQKRTWTFWIFSDWKYYQLTVPSPCSLLATYYSYSCLTAITSRPQALLLTHHHISPYHLRRGKPAQKAVERLVPRNPPWQWIPRHRVHERHRDNG